MKTVELDTPTLSSAVAPAVGAQTHTMRL
ncbi:MAG TPA: diaminobutyrate acetyltransferase, partial [Achromobacter sp.]|nr:diaminobutyrate acetyltransferase [Achromobacter sp.]